jgi:TonB family protein
MNKLLLLVTTLCLIAGCASNEPQYQVGSQSGGRQTKAEAERTHANQTALIAPAANFDIPPRVLSSQFPDYPPSWRNAGIVGTVVVSFFVEPDGSVSNPAIQGAPPSQLAAVTLNSIMQWKFAPATKAGVPVRVRAQQQFVFKTE